MRLFGYTLSRSGERERWVKTKDMPPRHRSSSERFIGKSPIYTESI